MIVIKIILIIVILVLTATACTVKDGIIHGSGTSECMAHPELYLLIIELRQLTERIHVLFSTMFSYEQGSPKREAIKEEYEALRQRHTQLLDEIIAIGPTVIPCMLTLINDGSIKTAIRIDGVIVLGQVTKDQNNEVVIFNLLENLPFMERVGSIAVMGALFNIGKPAIPYVITQLNNKADDKRIWAFELLKIMTAQTFDFYDPRNSDETIRRQAVDKIRDWWKHNESKWRRPQYNE